MDRIKEVHDYYLHMGGMIQKIEEFFHYFTVWLNSIGQNFDTVYIFVVSQS